MDAGIDSLRGGMASQDVPLPAFDRLAEWLEEHERAELAASIREQLPSGQVSLSDDDRRALADAAPAADLAERHALAEEFEGR